MQLLLGGVGEGRGGATARRLRRQAVGFGGSEACGVFDGYKVEIGGTKTNEKFVITNVRYCVIIKIGIALCVSTLDS